MSDFEKSINASDLIDWIMCAFPDWCVGDVRKIVDHIEEMLSAQSEPEEFEWCTDCKEYDQERHCCHRWTKVIRKTVEELKADNPEIIFCKNCKHWYPDADTGMACEYTNMSQPEDGFCNWAERRKDDGRTED